MTKQNRLASIIMLSHDKGRYIEESLKSVQAQTYTDWELLFISDSADDNTLKLITHLQEADSRIKISQIFKGSGESVSRNAALQDARGKWIAFLDAGDIWHPEKMERQIHFMEENDYRFTYTCYGVMNEQAQEINRVISGKKHITHKEMLKCCWPGYLTVMYDAEFVGKIHSQKMKVNSDYAIWLEVSKKAECHLLEDNLATMRIFKKGTGNIIVTNKYNWRYNCYYEQEGLAAITSFFYTLRNLLYGPWKWLWYVNRIKV